MYAQFVCNAVAAVIIS